MAVGDRVVDPLTGRHGTVVADPDPENPPDGVLVIADEDLPTVYDEGVSLAEYVFGASRDSLQPE